MMRKTVAIVSIAVLIGFAVPATLAHTEENPDACSEQKGKNCTPEGVHHACTGTRDWHKSGDDGFSVRSINLGNSLYNVSAYVNMDPLSSSGDDDEDEGLLSTPALLYLETNGFSGLQRSDWHCMSVHHDDANTWEAHPDQVVL